MFQFFMISIVVMPILIGVYAARGRERRRSRRKLTGAWVTYALLWICVLYYLRFRWS